MDPDFKKVGIATCESQTYGTLVVITYAGNFLLASDKLDEV
jgi:hypothetical protein